jgi:phage replication-related protein YjqB (UPF0714/DUF867 family)
MVDKYRNFAELVRNEKENSDFQIRWRECRGTAAIVAPHGGGIEPGTSELAEAIAGADLSFYAFEGIKKSGKGDLHITSCRFDEPRAAALVNASPRVIALHGELDSPDLTVFLGGLDIELGKLIQAALEAAGFVVRTHDDPNLQGVDKNNICNRGRSGRGVQLELSRPLRRSFFRSFNKSGRQHMTDQGERLVDAMRRAIRGEQLALNVSKD